MTIQKRKKTFVLIIPSFEDIFHSFYAGEIIKGVSLAASRLKVDILIHITDRFNHKGWLDSSLLDKKFISGIIFADIDNDIGIVKKAIRRGMPCMVLNNSLTEPINCISIDNKNAAHQVMEHLISMGHKKIATIAGDLSTQAGQMRLDGYQEVMAKYKLAVPKNFVTYGDFLRTPARLAAEKILKARNKPSAIFVASDVMAMELIAVAKKYHIRVPQDLSVVGFDDNPLNTSCSVRLTTVPQPLIEMGRLGTENLYQIIQGKAQLPVKIFLSTRLIVRESTKKADTRRMK